MERHVSNAGATKVHNLNLFPQPLRALFDEDARRGWSSMVVCGVVRLWRAEGCAVGLTSRDRANSAAAWAPPSVGVWPLTTTTDLPSTTLPRTVKVGLK